jgi:hypothetical protein
MRRDAHARRGQGRDGGAAALDQVEEAIGIVDETTLAGGCRCAAKTAIGVERGQQGEADPRLRARGGNALRHLSEISVGPAVDVVMQIMELAHRGEARLQHFHIGEGGDRLDVVGRQALQEPVHHLAPGPEAVGSRTAALGKPGHATLERVAMQIGNARNGDAGDAIGGGARHSCGDRSDASVGDRDADIAGPTGGQQRVIEKQLASQILVSALRAFLALRMSLSENRFPLFRDMRQTRHNARQ